jgi:hypothetical protein
MVVETRAPRHVSWDSAVGWRQINEIDRLGDPAQFFLDDRPAAPGQRIGHHQRPCTHSPDFVVIHLQYGSARFVQNCTLSGISA